MSAIPARLADGCSPVTSLRIDSAATPAVRAKNVAAMIRSARCSAAHHQDHGHDHGPDGIRGFIAGVFPPHSHDAAESIDSALTASTEGIRALKISLAGLAVTAAFQFVIVLVSGSVALLGDTIHNFSDALTAVPLGIAFLLARRPPNKRYTYGYGGSEDLAGIFVVGRKIGSAPLVADGLHARTDGLTSVAVVVGALGVAAGWQLADPIVGLLITVAILFVLKDDARDIYRRLMDSVEPELVESVHRVLASVPGVLAVETVRIRWIGHGCEPRPSPGPDMTTATPVRSPRRAPINDRHGSSSPSGRTKKATDRCPSSGNAVDGRRGLWPVAHVEQPRSLKGRVRAVEPGLGLLSDDEEGAEHHCGDGPTPPRVGAESGSPWQSSRSCPVQASVAADPNLHLVTVLHSRIEDGRVGRVGLDERGSAR